ncbi:MAG: hypothetical protein N2515_05540, partial [Deltaproteobacteria bacterium]|nr:hypothetical protein [Deltaproteobacteria bacterium]
MHGKKKSMHPVLLSGLALLGQACIKSYSQPKPDEPHARVHVRVVHHAALGPQLDELVTINGEALTLNQVGPGTKQTTVRVRPEATRYGFETEYFHTVVTQEWQTYNDIERYQCGYNPRTGPVWCTRTVPRQRLATVERRVSDGGCSTVLDQQPLAGAEYLLSLIHI